jgi:hypothetical protein
MIILSILLHEHFHRNLIVPFRLLMCHNTCATSALPHTDQTLGPSAALSPRRSLDSFFELDSYKQATTPPSHLLSNMRVHGARPLIPPRLHPIMAAVRIEAGLRKALGPQGQPLDSAAAILSHFQSPLSTVKDGVEPPRKRVKGNDGAALAVPALADQDTVVLARVEIALVSSLLLYCWWLEWMEIEIEGRN